MTNEIKETDPTKMVRDTLEIADKICNDWEIKFLEDMKGRLKSGAFMTERMLSKIKELYARACASPY